MVFTFFLPLKNVEGVDDSLASPRRNSEHRREHNPNPPILP